VNISLEKLTDWQGWLELLLPYGLKLVGAIAIFVIGRWIVRFVVRFLKKMLGRASTDETVVHFLGVVANIILMAFVIIAALGQLGVQTTAAAAIIGGAALALGLSLQGQISSVASGVLLIFFKPISKGHFVELAGKMGIVERIDIVSTVLLTTNNQEITIPNSQVWSNPITNYSIRPIRRMDLTVSISYDDDIDKAKQILLDIIAADERVLAEPVAAVVVNAMGESSIDLLFRPWFNTGDFWGGYWDMVETIKKRFDEENITIPFPQRDVHFYGGPPAASGGQPPAN
jgi:small conductance mechanosensitive channel